ncbi:MAG: hypothetical protein OXF60_06165, partial [Gammaproteobacteria bacterium]|nr:hypothetical protein [Gammaproteobacteria bacterium]
KCCNSNRTSSIKNTFLYRNRLIEIMQFELRNLSYNHQYSDEIQISINLTAKVMAELDSCHSRAKIQDLMNELHEVNPRKYCFPADMNAKSFFMHLVHQGALHKESVDRFVCPIPSFRAYLMDRGGI